MRNHNHIRNMKGDLSFAPGDRTTTCTLIMNTAQLIVIWQNAPYNYIHSR